MSRPIPKHVLAAFEDQLQASIIKAFKQAIRGLEFKSSEGVWISEAQNSPQLHKFIAARIGYTPKVVKELIDGTRRWTLDNVSDMFLAIGMKAKFELKDIETHELLTALCQD